MQLSSSISVSTIEDGTAYYLTSTVPGVTIASGASSASLSATIRFYKREGGVAAALFPCRTSAYTRKGTTFTRISSTSGTNSYSRSYSNASYSNATLKYNCTTAIDALVVCMFSAAYSGTAPLTQSTLLAWIEIPILKNGDNGQDAVTYEIKLNSPLVTVHGTDTPTPTRTPSSITGTFFKTIGQGSPTAETMFCVAQDANNVNMVTPDYYSSISFQSSAITGFPVTIKVWASEDDSTGVPLAIATVNGVSDGVTGSRGKTGRFYYYAGVWEDFEATDTFSVSDAQAPFFQYTYNGEKRYAVFNPTENGTYTKAQMSPLDINNDSRWEAIYDEFKYLITEAIFGKYAQFGSAIINGDWLISAHGTIGGIAYNNGATYTSEPQYEEVHNPLTGISTMQIVTPAVTGAAYTFFNPEFYDESFHGNQDVNGKEWYGYNYVPRYALDLRRGDFHASTGTFGGWLRHVPRLITAENILNFVTKASRKVNGTDTDVCLLDIRKTGPSFVLYDLDPTGALPDEDMRMESLATVLDEEHGCDQLWLDLPWCSTHVSVNGTVYGWASAQVQVDSAAFGFREAYAAVGNTVHVWNYSSANLYVDGGLAFKGSEDAVPEKEASEMVAGDALECGGEMFATSQVCTINNGSGTGVAARWVQWWRQPANAGGYTYPHSLPYRSFALQIAED